MSTRSKNSIANLSEELLKQQGDRLFKANKFDEAIKSYTGAVCKNPTNYKHLMDRALCYEKLKQWELFALDWRRALDIKAQMLYTAGLLLGDGVGTNEGLNEVLNEAIKYSDSVRYAARRQVENISKEYALKLERTRKKRWIDFESTEIDCEKQLLLYMTKLLKAEKKSRLSQLKKNKYKLTQHEHQAKKQEIKQECEDHSKELSKIFDKLKDRRRSPEVPDYLFCPISYKIFKDPVITPSGITYERKYIEKHLKKCGSFDPVTRARLSVNQLIPNRAIINAVDSFLANNEWARYE